MYVLILGPKIQTKHDWLVVVVYTFNPVYLGD